MEHFKIKDSHYILDVKNSRIDGSSFSCVSMKKLLLDDVSMVNTRISNANLSHLAIDGAQLGGAYFHNISSPPKDHPAYVAGANPQPMTFDCCDFTGSSMSNCNLSGVELVNCNVKGMKINGILIDTLLRAYENSR